MIALVTDKINQYSETFIHNQIKFLKGNVLVLGDGYISEKFSEDRGATWNTVSRESKKRFWLLRKQKLSQEDSIVHLLKSKHVDVVLAQFGPVGVAWMPICKRADIPLIVHFHGFDAYRSDILSSVGLRYPELFKQAAAIIVVSHHMGRQLVNLGCLPEKLNFIPYGVDIDFFTPGNEPSQPQLLACGRFVAKKNPIKTIEAFNLAKKVIPNLQLTMIGDGPLLEASKNKVDDLDLNDSVRFAGVCLPEEVRDIMRDSMIFIQHSCIDDNGDAEGLPLAILEAGACGLPVVSTKHTGIPDTVIDGQTGFLVAEGDTKSMAEKITRLVWQKEERRRMRKAARKQIRTRFARTIYLSTLDKLIARVVSRQAEVKES